MNIYHEQSDRGLASDGQETRERGTREGGRASRGGGNRSDNE